MGTLWLVDQSLTSQTYWLIDQLNLSWPVRDIRGKSPLCCPFSSDFWAFLIISIFNCSFNFSPMCIIAIYIYYNDNAFHDNLVSLGTLYYFSVSRNNLFDQSFDWLTSQTGQLTGQTSVKSKSPSPHPSCHRPKLGVIHILNQLLKLFKLNWGYSRGEGETLKEDFFGIPSTSRIPFPDCREDRMSTLFFSEF